MISENFMTRMLNKIRPTNQYVSTDGTLTLKKSLGHFMYMSISSAISFLASNGSNSLAFIFIGAVGSVNMQAGHALGFSIGNILVLTLGLGFTNGMDTFCPLMIGLGCSEGCWTYLFQGTFVVAACFPVLLLISLFSYPIMKLLTPNEAVALISRNYLIVTLPSLFFMSFFEAVRKFLIYQKDTISHLVIALLSIPLQLLLLWLYVSYLGMGAIGAALAKTVAWFLLYAMSLVYLWYYREYFGWSRYMSGSYKKFQNKLKNFPNDPVARSFVELEMNQVNTQPEKPESGKHISDDSSKTTKKDSSTYNLQKSDKLLDSKYGNIERSNTESLPISALSHSGSITVPNVADTNSIRLSQSVMDSALLPSDKKAIVQFHDHWYQGLSVYIKVAFPSTILSLAEWIGFEAQIIGASYISEEEVAALSATMVLGALIFFIHLSMGVVATGEVGRALGSSRPKDAKTLSNASLLGGLISGTFLTVLMLAARYPLSKLFSKTPKIQDLLYMNLIVQASIIIVDAWHAIFGGIIRAQNLQLYGCVMDLVCLLFLMPGSGFLMALLTPLAGRGFLIGEFIGLSVCTIMYYIMVYVCIDWDARSQMLSKKPTYQ